MRYPRLAAAPLAALLLFVPGGSAAAAPLSCSGGWTQVYLPYPLPAPPLSTGILSSTEAVSRTDVWFAGLGSNPVDSGPYVQVQHYDGHTVTELPHARVGSYWDIVDVNHGSGKLSFDRPDDGWLVASYMTNEEVYIDDGTAGGNFPSHSVLEHWNGHRWIVTQLEVRPGERFDGAAAIGVHALSPTNAWVVGSTGSFAAERALIEHWDGRRWRVVPQPGADLDQSRLYTVTGTSSHDLWAVGRYFAADTERTLTEHWDGYRWTIVPSPNPAGATLSALVAVSAAAPDDVWAVGSWVPDPAVRQIGLVEHWDGRTWTVVQAVDQPGANSTLSDVLAFGPSDVYAIGLSGPQHWDGHRWSLQPVSSDPAFGTAYLGISGADPRSVWIAGFLDTFSVLSGGRVFQNLALHRC